MFQLTEKAREQQFMYQEIYFPRSREKFKQGSRTQKRLADPDVWKWLTEKYGTDLLFSGYMSHEFCVVTTKKNQYGFLLEEVPEPIQAVLRGVKTKPLTVAMDKDGVEFIEPLPFKMYTHPEAEKALGAEGCWKLLHQYKEKLTSFKFLTFQEFHALPRNTEVEAVVMEHEAAPKGSKLVLLPMVDDDGNKAIGVFFDNVSNELPTLEGKEGWHRFRGFA